MKAHAENKPSSARQRIPGFLLFCVASSFLLFASPLNAQTKWVGVDTVWTNPSNWANGVVPGDTSCIVINIGAPSTDDAYVPPPTGSDTACVCDLTINSVGRLRFVDSPQGILKVCGTVKLLQNGLIDLAGGKIIFKGSVSLQGTGLFEADSGVITLEGTSWNINSGATFVPGTSTMVLEGTGDQTITGNISFYNLIINTQGTVTIAGAVSVQNNLTLAAGSTVEVDSGYSLSVDGTVTGDGAIVGDGAHPLPVEMSSISARATKAGVELRWTTATEVNNFGFDVERRSPGVGWTKIGFLAGTGTSNVLHNYSFADDNAGVGLIEYRIKQIDRDGSFKYSAVVQVEVAGVPRVLSLGSNYPNPFNPTTTLEFTVLQDGKVTLKVYSLLGQEVATLFDGLATAGRFYKIIFNASQLSSGIYFARLESSGRALVRRMVLVK